MDAYAPSTPAGPAGAGKGGARKGAAHAAARLAAAAGPKLGGAAEASAAKRAQSLRTVAEQQAAMLRQEVHAELKAQATNARATQQTARQAALQWCSLPSPRVCHTAFRCLSERRLMLRLKDALQT